MPRVLAPGDRSTLTLDLANFTGSEREFRVRVMGQYTSPEQVLQTVLTYREGTPVYVSDVAEVELGYKRQRGFVRSLNGPALAMNVIRQTDANVMELMSDLRVRLAEVQSDIIPKIHPELGPHIRLRQVYDETTYIHSAINLVTQNLWVGGLIAAAAVSGDVAGPNAWIAKRLHMGVPQAVSVHVRRFDSMEEKQRSKEYQKFIQRFTE